MKNKILYLSLLMAGVAGGMTSCNDYLNQEPQSKVSPDQYFNDETSFANYANGLYTSVLPSHGNWSYGIFGEDNHTDNMATKLWDDKYVPGLWKTTDADGDNWNWTNINDINYFLTTVEPKLERGEVSGLPVNLNQYLGEMYFLRAYAYFKLYQRYGDLPIIKESLPDDLAVLIQNSERKPRNEVARFILSDLDKAYELMKPATVASTRINAQCAMLVKSRVALYEGTWLKNFAGTAFVPLGEGWPGFDREYSKGYQYPTGSVEEESKWFLKQSMDAAKIVADNATLMTNTGIVPQEEGKSLADYEAQNPYLAMFGAEDLSKYGEVLLWRAYSKGLGITHNVVVMAQEGNCLVGTTRGMVDAFTMANGLPIYAAGSGYHGDDLISNVRMDRDPRLFVFLKEPGQKNVLIANSQGDHANPVETYPKLLEANAEHGYSTGYALRKGNNFDQIQCSNGGNYTACPVFRSAEALLNYIEACYELNGNLDGTADGYWRKIRARHEGLEQDYNVMVNATDMQEEAKGDWGAYTAGQIIDKLRYNIRRERRMELMAEGFRWMDLTRWRAMDQMVTTGYHIEGIHIWGTPMQQWYDQAQLAEAVSSPSISAYVRPHEAKGDSQVKDGLKWTMAHYLRYIPCKQFRLTAENGTDPNQSPMYQNPYWPNEPNLAATK